MSNETERVAFKGRFRKTTDVREILERNSFTNAITEQMWRGFQAGAAYQRTQAQPADALVGALEQITRMTYDEWTNGAFAKRIAEDALAAHKGEPT